MKVTAASLWGNWPSWKEAASANIVSPHHGQHRSHDLLMLDYRGPGSLPWFGISLKGPFQSFLWPIKINFSLCPISLLSYPLIYGWQEHFSINFLHPSLHLRVGFPGNPSTLFSLSFFHITTIFPLSSPFPLCIGWSSIPVCWGQSYFILVNLVTPLASILFNLQKDPDLDYKLNYMLIIHWFHLVFITHFFELIIFY